MLAAAIAPEEYKNPWAYYLRQYRTLAGGVTLVSETRLADDTSDFGSLINRGQAAIRIADTECVILTGGHLLRYCLATSSITHGPIDISREPEDGAEWYIRDEIALDADNRTIFLRSWGRSVIAVDAFSFERRYFIEGTASRHAPSEIMLPCKDGGVIVSLRNKKDEDVLTRYSPSGDSGTSRAVRTFQFDEHSVTSIHRLNEERFAYGTSSGKVGILDINLGRTGDKKMLHNSGSVKIITRVPGTDSMATVSDDGTVRFFPITG